MFSRRVPVLYFKSLSYTSTSFLQKEEILASFDIPSIIPPSAHMKPHFPSASMLGTPIYPIESIEINKAINCALFLHIVQLHLQINTCMQRYNVSFSQNNSELRRQHLSVKRAAAPCDLRQFSACCTICFAEKVLFELTQLLVPFGSQHSGVLNLGLSQSLGFCVILKSQEGL